MLSACLEWAVVAVPILVGLIQWVTPISKPKRRHRTGVLVGCAIFSILIWGQQRVAREERSKEVANFPTKEDLKQLPTVNDIVGEFKRIAPSGVNQTPWGMTDSQLTKLSQRLAFFAPFSPEKGDLITAVLGDQDSIKFAQQLAGAFRAAQWRGVGGTGFGQAIFGGPVQGIVIKLRDKEDRPPGLSEFVSSLREAGIEPTGEIAPNDVPKDEFRIIIGSRPSP